MSININFDIEGGRNAGLLTPKVTRNPGGIKIIIENCTPCISTYVVSYVLLYMSTIASSSVYNIICQALGTMCIVAWVILQFMPHDYAQECIVIY